MPHSAISKRDVFWLLPSTRILSYSVAMASRSGRTWYTVRIDGFSTVSHIHTGMAETLALSPFSSVTFTCSSFHLPSPE